MKIKKNFFCGNFSCRLKGRCINEPVFCKGKISCDMVRYGSAVDRCNLCYLVNSCVYAKEMKRNGKHN